MVYDIPPREAGVESDGAFILIIEHHSFLSIEVLPSSQLASVSMATRVSRSVF